MKIQTSPQCLRAINSFLIIFVLSYERIMMWFLIAFDFGIWIKQNKTRVVLYENQVAISSSSRSQLWKRIGQAHENHSLIMEKPTRMLLFRLSRIAKRSEQHKISRLPTRVLNINRTPLFPEPPRPYQEMMYCSGSTL